MAGAQTAGACPGSLLNAKVPKVRDLNALALILSGKGGGHGDQRKAVDKKCCRGKQGA
jgi:hypothetical protein